MIVLFERNNQQAAQMLFFIFVFLLRYTIVFVDSQTGLVVEHSVSGVSDWELVPPGGNVRTISPVGSSLKSILTGQDFLPTPRPDNLAPIGLLYVATYKLLGLTFFPGRQINLPEQKRQDLIDELGDHVIAPLHKAIISQLTRYWKEQLHGYYKGIAQRNGLKVNIQLRADLACPTGAHPDPSVGGLETRRKAVVLFAFFQPYVYTQYQKKRLPSIGWTTLLKVSEFIGLKVQGGANVYMAMALSMRKWQSRLTQPVAISRERDFGPRRIQPPQLPMPDYETKYLSFTFKCPQSAILGMPQTVRHCVILPVEIKRLYREEKILIECMDEFPEGTQVFWFQPFPHAITGQLVLGLRWTSCKSSGWEEPRTISEKEGMAKYQNCIMSGFTETW